MVGWIGWACLWILGSILLCVGEYLWSFFPPLIIHHFLFLKVHTLLLWILYSLQQQDVKLLGSNNKSLKKIRGVLFKKKKTIKCGEVKKQSNILSYKQRYLYNISKTTNQTTDKRTNKKKPSSHHTAHGNPQNSETENDIITKLFMYKPALDHHTSSSCLLL